MRDMARLLVISVQPGTVSLTVTDMLMTVNDSEGVSWPRTRRGPDDRARAADARPARGGRLLRAAGRRGALRARRPDAGRSVRGVGRPGAAAPGVAAGERRGRRDL